jgi:hypothetical protein
MRSLLNSFDKQFLQLHERSVQLVKMIPDDKLYWTPNDVSKGVSRYSCGEFILRSAGTIEQTFGGLTTKLWDDPIEWTLPEALPTSESVLEYLNEVEETRRKGFKFFQTDEDLYRELPAPEKLKPIAQLLLEILSRAEHFQGKAFAVFQMFSGEKLPRIAPF